MTNYLTKKQMTAAKTRLTRAERTGDPQKIVEEVDRTFAEWDRGDYAYPDNWHRWNIARTDATLAIARQNW